LGKAFEVTQNVPLDGIGLDEASLSQQIYLTPDTLYKLTFDTFDVGNGGFVGLKLH